MDCSEAKQVVRILLIDQGTSPPRELDEHLRECRACETRFGPLLAFASKLQHLPERELPAGFDARFRRRLVRKMPEEGRKGWKSALVSLVASDEFRGVLVFGLSVGPVAVAVGGAVGTPPHRLLISASNMGVIGLALLFAAAFGQTVLHWDTIAEIFRSKRV